MDSGSKTNFYSGKSVISSGFLSFLAVMMKINIKLLRGGGVIISGGKV